VLAVFDDWRSKGLLVPAAGMRATHV
jgi:hypothetical protein